MYVFCASVIISWRITRRPSGKSPTATNTMKSTVKYHPHRQHSQGNNRFSCSVGGTRKHNNRGYFWRDVGRQDEDFLFSVENSSYKLRDIFLPSTMLVTKQLAQSGRPREVSYVSLGKAKSHRNCTLSQAIATQYRIQHNLSRNDGGSSQQGAFGRVSDDWAVGGCCWDQYQCHLQSFQNHSHTTLTRKKRLNKLLKHMPVTVFHSRDL